MPYEIICKANWGLSLYFMRKLIKHIKMRDANPSIYSIYRMYIWKQYNAELPDRTRPVPIKHDVITISCVVINRSKYDLTCFLAFVANSFWHISFWLRVDRVNCGLCWRLKVYSMLPHRVLKTKALAKYALQQESRHFTSLFLFFCIQRDILSVPTLREKNGNLLLFFFFLWLFLVFFFSSFFLSRTLWMNLSLLYDNKTPFGFNVSSAFLATMIWCLFLLLLLYCRST